MGSRFRISFAALAAALALVAAVPALAAISGPTQIKPGKRVSFKVTGAGASKQLTVKLATKGGGGVVLRQKPTTDASGKATVAFRVPQKYNVKISCNSVYAECETKPWKNGQKVKLKVCPTGGGCQSRRLEIKK